ncbi:MAG: TetR/AcrR family transcriptional regulator [Nostocoides sp.]
MTPLDVSRVGADSRERIRMAALRLFADRGVAASSLREVARVAGVAPGLVVHHFGGKDGLQADVDGAVTDIFARALDSVLPQGPNTATLTPVEVVDRMFRDHPEAMDYLRRAVVTPSPGDEQLLAKLLQLTLDRTRAPVSWRPPSSDVPPVEQTVAVLVRLLGSRLVQPGLSRLWTVAQSDDPPPTIEVPLQWAGEQPT